MAEEDLCQYHRKAKDNLVSNFKKWQEAYGGLTWAEYCQRLSSLQETGIWVKEVIDYMLRLHSEGESKWS